METRRFLKNAALGAARGATRSARYVLEGEARHRMAPIRLRWGGRTATVQSVTGRQIDRLAEQIRWLGRRLERPEEAHLLARRLEETADYIRFRPAAKMFSDAGGLMRRYPSIPIALGVLGLFVGYRMLCRRRY